MSKRSPRHGLGKAFASVAAISMALVVPSGVARATGPNLKGHWTTVASMREARKWHTATLLANGAVLVAGSSQAISDSTSGAEIFHPKTDTWSPTGAMNTKRGLHTATLLAKQPKQRSREVLIVGGTGCIGCGSDALPLTSAELYNPDTNAWSPTGSMSAGRIEHTATLLDNGKVLVTGGEASGDGSDFEPLASAELYDPATGTWSLTGPMGTARAGHTATLLPNGKVLVTGGFSCNVCELGITDTAEIYDPATGTWAPTASMSLARQSHTATLLHNGKVLVAGGQDSSGATTSSAELYDPAVGAWHSAAPMPLALSLQTATLLRDHSVLIAGGGPTGEFSQTDSAELYDPTADVWRTLHAMNQGRCGHTATLLRNGGVLVVGGNIDDSGDATNSAELFR